jgi:predicted Zn-dependent protease
MKRKLLFITVILITIWSCSQVPVTGRRQINLLPEAQIMEMSFANYNQFLTDNKGKVIASGPQVELVKKTGLRISRAVEQYMRENQMASRISNFKWEFNVVDDKAVNAWCMPGGKVVVYTGILPVTKDETGLAVVMGHEIAHAVANHGNERMSQGLMQELGFAILDQALSEKPDVTRSIFLSAYGVGSDILGILPYSRLHESEADKLGLIFMAMAGYDPSKAVDFWGRMAKIGGQTPPELLSTHPNSETRIRQIQEFLPEARKYYKPNTP